MFKKTTQTIKVTTKVPDVDFFVEHKVSLTVKVPISMPAENLKDVVTNAAGWCQQMAEKFSEVNWKGRSGEAKRDEKRRRGFRRAHRRALGGGGIWLRCPYSY